tara:strand:- start:133 stop:714 length:582 start_codon:yes stop_codon:yes gene_type:complete
MGFDLTGLNPKNKKYKSPSNDLYKKDKDKFFEELEKYQSQKGTYFRNNVWWWRPLAEYVLKETKVILESDQDGWHYNDCHEVSKEDAEQIAKQLRYLIESGHTKKFAKDWETRRKKIEKYNEQVEKELEEHTKQVQTKMKNDNLAPKDFSKEDHDKWERIYRKRNHDGSYPFSVENVEEFAEFCENSGGFSIG